MAYCVAYCRRTLGLLRRLLQAHHAADAAARSPYETLVDFQAPYLYGVCARRGSPYETLVDFTRPPPYTAPAIHGPRHSTSDRAIYDARDIWRPR